jgi:hypothetical protein
LNPNSNYLTVIPISNELHFTEKNNTSKLFAHCVPDQDSQSSSRYKTQTLPLRAVIKNSINQNHTMKKFIVLYHSPAPTAEQMANVKPEQFKAMMDMWNVWGERCGKGLVEMGAPLKGGQNISASGGRADSKRQVSGYSVLQAVDIDAATALLDGHPHLHGAREGHSIGLHEVAPM